MQCFLIGDSTGINKENIDATLKYFDCEGEMDYFGFIEQLKKIIEKYFQYNFYFQFFLVNTQVNYSQ